MFKKILIWSGRALIALAALWALVHVVEDWRGKRAWESWKREHEARGVRYDLESLQTPPVPDDENFAKAPIVARTVEKDLSLIEGLTFPKPPEPHRTWRMGERQDLAAWRAAFNAKDLESALAPAGRSLDELAEASRRPGCQFPFPKDSGDFQGGFLRFRSATRLLSLRALDRLAKGRVDKAAEDVLTGLRVGRHLGSASSLTGRTAGEAVIAITLQPIWEGLQAHSWSEAQLAAIQFELSRIELLTVFQRWGESERISSLKWMIETLDGSNKELKWQGKVLIPRGWLYQNLINADRFGLETWAQSVDPSTHRIYPDKAKALETWWVSRGTNPYTFFARITGTMGGLMVNQAQQIGRMQSDIDKAMSVCGLERYRLSHGGYPMTLGELAPGFVGKLPPDVTTGEPLHYRRTEDGGFLLYSVGWDGKDDGGTIAMTVATKCDPPHQDLAHGDWPWPQAASH